MSNGTAEVLIGSLNCIDVENNLKKKEEEFDWIVKKLNTRALLRFTARNSLPTTKTQAVINTGSVVAGVGAAVVIGSAIPIATSIAGVLVFNTVTNDTGEMKELNKRCYERGRRLGKALRGLLKRNK